MLPFNREIDADFRDANVSFNSALAELKRIEKGYVEHHSVMNESDRREVYDSKHMSSDTLWIKEQSAVWHRIIFLSEACGKHALNVQVNIQVKEDPKSGLKYVIKCSDELTKNHGGDDRESTSGVMPEFPGSPSPMISFEKYLNKLDLLCESIWQRPRRHSKMRTTPGTEFKTWRKKHHWNLCKNWVKKLVCHRFTLTIQ